MSYAIHAFRNWRAVSNGTRPSHIFFEDELKWLLGCDVEWLRESAREYRSCPAAWRWLSNFRSTSRRTDGPAKTVDVAEGFVIWTLVKKLSPRVVVELGTQHGLSARVWKEALRKYVSAHDLILCDLIDSRLFIGDDECTFIKGDARLTLPAIFDEMSVDVLYNDAHPYDLVRWSVEEGLKHGVKAFVFHDVGRFHPRGPFKFESAQLTQKEKRLHSMDLAQYGHWERHVMAELFDPRILHQDSAAGSIDRIQIFDSLFGVGVVLRSANSSLSAKQY
jgi:hypothetical protein